VHNSTCHSAEECREIKKLTEQYREQLKQQRGDGASSHQREGKQKADPKEDKEDEMRFQKTKRDLMAVYGHSDSKPSDNEHHKTLYVPRIGERPYRNYIVVEIQSNLKISIRRMLVCL
jgi:hypothetical protein